MTSIQHINGGEIIIYQSKDGKLDLQVKLQKETIWLDSHQIASLFEVNRPAIVKHVQNIYKSSELKPDSTCSKMEQVAPDGKIRKMNYYNLDMIISVGYRVNSKRATQFRIWATTVLKDHILKGYTLNQKRLQETGLKEFEETVGLIKQTMQSKLLEDKESKGLLEVITSYASTWLLLQKYDEAQLPEPKTSKAKKKIDYAFCHNAIHELKTELVRKKEASELFGHERTEQFKSVIGNIYQTFDRQELYPSIEEKAAHLLYFVIKDHPFMDGNKRIGSFLFIVFLAKNNYLVRKNGERKINDHALVAIALLIAESQPRQKDLMVRLIMHFLSEKV